MVELCNLWARATGFSAFLCSWFFLCRQVKVEARKMEHRYPHSLKVKYRQNPSTNRPKSMFQLSGNHCSSKKDERQRRSACHTQKFCGLSSFWCDSVWGGPPCEIVWSLGLTTPGVQMARWLISVLNAITLNPNSKATEQYPTICENMPESVCSHMLQLSSS